MTPVAVMRLSVLVVGVVFIGAILAFAAGRIGWVEFSGFALVAIMTALNANAVWTTDRKSTHG